MQGNAHVVPGGRQKTAPEAGLGGEGDRVQHAVERPPTLLEIAGGRFDLLGRSDVQFEHVRRYREVLGDPPGQRKAPAEVAEHHLRTFALGQLRHPVGDRVIGEDPRDQDALSLEKCRHGERG